MGLEVCRQLKIRILAEVIMIFISFLDIFEVVKQYMLQAVVEMQYIKPKTVTANMH